ncbi:28265_t:CDS:2, partial [Racocetra persica]
MSEIKKLIERNQNWSKTKSSKFFEDLTNVQEPKFIWIGCSDSRCSPEITTQSDLGVIFVLRNIANQFKTTDLSALSVLEYAVEHLKVKHIIVCGHYECGGVGHVIDSLYNNKHGHVDNIDNWLKDIKEVYLCHSSQFDKLDKDEKKKLLVELNITKQVIVYGLVYNMKEGMLKILNATIGDAKPYSRKKFNYPWGVNEDMKTPALTIRSIRKLRDDEHGMVDYKENAPYEVEVNEEIEDGNNISHSIWLFANADYDTVRPPSFNSDAPIIYYILSNLRKQVEIPLLNKCSVNGRTIYSVRGTQDVLSN